HEYAAVPRIEDFLLEVLIVGPAGVEAIGRKHRQLLRLGLFRQPPVDDQQKIAVLLFGPDVAIGRALFVRLARPLQNSLVDDPMAGELRTEFPAGEGRAIENRPHSLIGPGDLFDRQVGAGEGGETNIAEGDFSPFSLKGDVSLLPAAFFNAGYELAV